MTRTIGEVALVGRPQTRRQPDAKGDQERPGAWKCYGRLLKLYRTRAGLTQAELGEKVSYSLELVSSIERGRRPAKVAFTERVEEVLSADGALRALQDEVDLAKLPAFFADYAQLEAEALSFSWYGGYVVPGLLQTEDYARALLNAQFPPLDEETVEQLLEGRMHRQNLLTRKKPPLVAAFLIEEVALRRPVGGSSVLKDQLHRLLERSALRNVEIQVMPTERGAHSGLNGSMVLLESTEQQHVAYIESQGASRVITDPKQASEFGLRYGKLRSQALNTEESARFLQRIAGEL